MANDWGNAVSNTIGYGKASEDGDNLVNELSTLLVVAEDSTFLISNSPTNYLVGYGEIYDTTWFGQTIEER